MKRIITLYLLITLFGMQSQTYGQWQKYIIDDDNINTAVSVDVADMDGDTKPDLIVTNELGNELIYYQNNFPFWTKRIIDANAPKVTFAWSADINSNNILDVVACLYGTSEIVWYQNNYPFFNKRIIDANTDHADFICVADLDNDDTLDVVTAGSYVDGGDVVWYENNQPTWIKHIIESGSGKYPSLSVSDIDNDGLLDLVATMNEENKVVWFKNENNGLSWTKYTIDNSLNRAWGINCFDIDGDDTMDVVATGRNDNDVIWYENNHPIWTKHVIDPDLSGANWVDVADVDGDDTMDVIAVGIGGDDVVWYENNHPIWPKHTIDANFNDPRVFAVSDVDGDEIKDLIVPGESSVVWYKNPYTPTASGESIDCYPKYISSELGDTLKVIAHISNPGNHPVKVLAIIEAENYEYQDSIELFDDGLHDDEITTDNIYANNIVLTDLEEDFFEVKLKTTDLNDSVTTYCPTANYFTTAGPIIWTAYTIQQYNDSLFSLKVTLQNNSDSLILLNIKAVLTTSDNNVTEIISNNNPQYYPDIEAGQSVQSNGIYAFYAKNNLEIVNFTLSIYSNNHLYWIDNIDVITGKLSNEITIPKDYVLEQNYPNPFNPSTVIKYSIPKQSNVTLKVFDVLGSEIATLVNKEQQQGNYEIEFDGKNLTSGIYCYRIQASDFVETKKMILLK